METSWDESDPSVLRGRARAAWRKRRAVELAMAGCSYEGIAEQVGYANKGTAWRVVHAALSQPVAERAEEYLELLLSRLEALLEAHWDAAVGGDPRALDAVLGVMDQEARLLRLDRLPTTSGPRSVVVPGVTPEYLESMAIITGGGRDRDQQEGNKEGNPTGLDD